MSVDIPSLFRREVENHPLYYNPVDGTVSNASVSNPQSAYYLFPQHTRSNILLTVLFTKVQRTLANFGFSRQIISSAVGLCDIGKTYRLTAYPVGLDCPRKAISLLYSIADWPVQVHFLALLNPILNHQTASLRHPPPPPLRQHLVRPQTTSCIACV